MDQAIARREIWRLVRRGTREGLLRGSFGNVSLRVGAKMLITPTASDYMRLTVDDYALVNIASGDAEHGNPSSEQLLHLEIYRRLPHVGAVFHDHSPAATAAGVVTERVPLYTGEGHGAIGLYLPVVPYMPSGTVAFARSATDALEAHAVSACLLRNHGVVATGPNLFAAYSCAWSVEEAAMHYFYVRGMPARELPPSEAQAIRAAFDDYRMR